MAVKTTVFRTKIPLLVTGSFLVLQPLAFVPVAFADNNQFACRPSASGGWDCSSAERSASLPPRPTTSVDPTATIATTDGKKASKATTPLATENKGRALTSRSADYSHLDWVPRDQLTPAQLAEIGLYCEGSYIEPDRVGMNDQTPIGEAPTYIAANTSRYNQEKQVGTLAGNVVLQQGSVQIEADQADLSRVDNIGTLSGNVKLRDVGALVVGDSAEVKLSEGEAQVENAEFVVHETHYRGNARYIKRSSDGLIRLKDGTFTRCEPSDNTWTIRGNNVVLNRETGRGTATNATLRVKDIPVMYSPYISFPIDKRRQTGFLMPSFSSSGDNGFTLLAPYYVNLAPNYDFTLYPQLMTKRGLLMEGEFRYLTENSQGQFAAAYLNDNGDMNEDRKVYGEDSRNRWMYSWQNTTGMNSRWLAEVDFTRLSDPFYFEDLDINSNGVNSRTYVNQKGKLTYRGDSFTAAVNVHAYQMATVSSITGYDRLPQLTLTGKLPFTPGGLNFNYDAEYVRFDRDLKDKTYTNFYEQPDPALQYITYHPDYLIQGLMRANGNRAYVAPEISLPLRSSWGYIAPSVQYMYTNYDLDLDSKGKQQMLIDGQRFKSSVDRSVVAYKIDSGLYFDRKVNWFGTNFKQTLEPRAMYLYVPYKKQDDIPIFDTSETPFDFDSLFRTNRFSGRDRIGDTNQVSVGLTSRLLEDNGFERQRVSIGQAYYFKDRKVQMPGIDWRQRSLATNDTSPIALQYLYRFNRDWRMSAAYNWSPEDSKTESGSVMLHYQPESNLNKIFNIGFRYRDDNVAYNWWTSRWQQSGDMTRHYYQYGAWRTDTIKDYYKIKQADTSFIWPIIPRWSLIGRWQYDYNRNRTLDSFGGIEYDSCCWQFRVVGRYWQKYDDGILSRTNSTSDRGIFFQIVFKGLGNVYGSGANGFLEKGIEGYRKREDQSF
ncbi:LPS-assembly protein LptD [Entomomonas asaccharolytica]|uniref:LPS-assembly protein LptD n=1 Tax=Entomomonas asaccharolytica TaxID=2785331 RepID=A0A974RXR1_9GAMM|nr:LPS-assembly protein LptD [Entomomonas asaccharolytica]QQP86526.1 LPS-assembly protein LptD [Entomomonas asaccharolytica]